MIICSQFLNSELASSQLLDLLRLALNILVSGGAMLTNLACLADIIVFEQLPPKFLQNLIHILLFLKLLNLYLLKLGRARRCRNIPKCLDIRLQPLIIHAEAETHLLFLGLRRLRMHLGNSHRHLQPLLRTLLTTPALKILNLHPI